MATAIGQEKINELLQKHSRTRGDYDGILRDFLESGEAGIEVELDSGPLAGKTAEQAKTGLDNARKRVNNTTGQPVIPGGHAVKVVKVGNSEKGEEQHLYLIDTTKVAGEQQTEEATA